MGRLTGKVALISGASRGMGASHARAIAAHGGAVVLGDIRDEEGEALAAEIGANAAYIHLDVTSEADWEAAVALAMSKFGALTTLVNNAGIADLGPLESFGRDRWDTIINVNLTGSYLGILAARAALIASAPSSIVNISSVAGFMGAAAAHAYVASKFGLRGLTKSVACELGSVGVRCNSIHPGFILTPATAGLNLDMIMGPMGRAGQPEEISNLVVYLASDESSYSTGSEFIADGGQLAGTGPVMPRDPVD